MRYAILGDVHSNWEALSAVLKDARQQGVSAYACIGDVVGYNSDPERCIDRLRKLDCATVRGNHDHYCTQPLTSDSMSADAAAAVAWTRGQLSPDHIRYLESLELSRKVENFTLVHSTLYHTANWEYIFNTLDAAVCFSHQQTQVCFHGHTHVPVVFKKHGRVSLSRFERISIAPGTRYLINVGSVGQPRDRDPRAAYVIYDLEEKEILLRRPAYDVSKTQEKIAKVGLPQRLGQRLSQGT